MTRALAAGHEDKLQSLWLNPFFAELLSKLGPQVLT